MSYAAASIFIKIDITEVYFHNRVHVYWHSIMPIQKKMSQMKVASLIEKTAKQILNEFDTGHPNKELHSYTTRDCVLHVHLVMIISWLCGLRHKPFLPT